MATRSTTASDFIGAANASTTAINTILAEEANRIGGDIHRRMVHTSPWIDLIPQTQFPDGMGYNLTTLVYDRAIPTKDDDGDAVGANWNAVGNDQGDANIFGTSVLDQPLKDAADSVQGPSGTVAGTDQRSFINFSKQLKQYNIKRAMIESPRVNVDDLRYAAHRQDQLRAIIDSLTEATRYTWENRYRDEFDRIADNIVVCKTASSAFNTGQENVASTALDVDADPGSTETDTAAGIEDDTSLITANISNAVLDKCYFQLIRKGAGGNGYGRENGRPVFGLVLSSEASYQLMTESGFRDDVRYNNAVVSDLIAPLGIEKSFRGFYHLIDDLAPRFQSDRDTDGGASPSTDTEDDTLNRVEPYTVTNGIVTVNPAYETAPFEAAYIIHPEVMESQIPAPFGGAGGVTFNPVNYKGDFKWTNILNEATNPDGSIGFFRGVLASASKPIKTDCGYVILFRRVSNTPAAV